MRRFVGFFFLVCTIAGFAFAEQNQKSNDFTFEFYSSSEQAMQFAYMNTLSSNWQFLEMQKDGNRFSVTLPVNEEIWYEFVTRTNTWYNKDPYNKYVKDDHPYLNKKIIKNGSYKIKNLKFVSSEHFDLFTVGKVELIDELEKQYKSLEIKLSIFGNPIAPVYNKKIRYHSGLFDGIYAEPGRAMVIDNKVDEANSHELIHVLMHDYPHFPALSEGVAQCFQSSGNKLPLEEGNCSLEAKRKITQTDISLKKVLSNFNENRDYHIAASFVYFNIFIKTGTTEGFCKFLKEFTDDKSNVSYAVVEQLFLKDTGQKLDDSINDWTLWVKGISESSNIYVDWN
jgi:hypothetical protein